MINGTASIRRNEGGRILTAAESVLAASELLSEEESRQLWPYPWVYPPKNSIRREPAGSIVAPAPATQTVILSFRVPRAFVFVWSDLLLTADVAGFVPGAGDVTWTVDVDTPLGVTLLSGSPIADMQAILFPRGSYANGPWKLVKAETLRAGQQLRAKVTVSAAITAGAPNYFSALFGGWLIPAKGGQ